MKPQSVARAPVSVLLAQLPSVDKLLLPASASEWISTYGRDELLRCIRLVLDEIRKKISSNNSAMPWL